MGLQPIPFSRSGTCPVPARPSKHRPSPSIKRKSPPPVNPAPRIFPEPVRWYPADSTRSLAVATHSPALPLQSAIEKRPLAAASSCLILLPSSSAALQFAAFRLPHPSGLLCFSRSFSRVSCGYLSAAAHTPGPVVPAATPRESSAGRTLRTARPPCDRRPVPPRPRCRTGQDRNAICQSGYTRTIDDTSCRNRRPYRWKRCRLACPCCARSAVAWCSAYWPGYCRTHYH